MTASAARRALRIAHRGDWRTASENTITAFEAALALRSCDGLEFDVRLSRDRTPVVIHDDTLDRVQGISGQVADLDAAQLAALRVPTLASVLAFVAERRPDAFLDVELKGADHGRRTADTLREACGDSPATTVVSSFEPETLDTMRAWLPRWSRWLNAADGSPATLELARHLGCAGVSLQWSAIREETIRGAGEVGLLVAAWTVRDEATAAALDALGVGVLCVEAEALDGGGEQRLTAVREPE